MASGDYIGCVSAADSAAVAVTQSACGPKVEAVSWQASTVSLGLNGLPEAHEYRGASQMTMSTSDSAVFLDYATVSLHDDLDPSSLRGVLPDLVIHGHTPDSLVDHRLEGRAIALSNGVVYDRPRIFRHPALRLIALTATGTNNVDLDAARERGVAVCNITNYCTSSVAQHVFAGLLGLTNHIRQYDRALKAGAWEGRTPMPDVGPIRELAGLTMGIVGFGTLGREVGRIAEAFGMKVLVAERRHQGSLRPGRVSLTEMLPQVDVLSLHCPINAETLHLIGAEELALMRRDAVIINTARGALIDPTALALALRERRIGGAMIDVLPEEPPSNGSPLLAPDLENVIVTPHLAWATLSARQRALEELAANVRGFLDGGSRNRVV